LVVTLIASGAPDANEGIGTCALGAALVATAAVPFTVNVSIDGCAGLGDCDGGGRVCDLVQRGSDRRVRPERRAPPAVADCSRRVMLPPATSPLKSNESEEPTIHVILPLFVLAPFSPAVTE